MKKNVKFQKKWQGFKKSQKKHIIFVFNFFTTIKTWTKSRQPSNVLPLYFNYIFPPIFWIFTKDEVEWIQSKLPFKIFLLYLPSIIFCLVGWHLGSRWSSVKIIILDSRKPRLIISCLMLFTSLTHPLNSPLWPK